MRPGSTFVPTAAGASTEWRA